jgi:thiamine-phosphate pyrophosphorylase
MRLVMPRLYVILDAGLIHRPVLEIASEMMDAGVQLLQYRDKRGTARGMLQTSSALSALTRRAGATFFVNDRPDIAFLSGAHGVHVGQHDVSPEQARLLMGPDRWVGVSTHNREQIVKAAASSADYIAIGPIFQTTSKVNPDTVVGTEIISELRSLTDKPMVAIGGIRLEQAEGLLRAGANSVAVISDILLAPNPKQRARQYVQRLEAVKLSH